MADEVTEENVESTEETEETEGSEETEETPGETEETEDSEGTEEIMDTENDEVEQLKTAMIQMNTDHALALAGKDDTITQLRAELARAISTLPNDSANAVESTEETNNEPLSWEQLAAKATGKGTD